MRPAPTRQPVLQVLALKFNERGTFQNMVADLKDVQQSTTSCTIYCMTTALLRRLPQEIRLPTSQREAADKMKTKIFRYDIICLLGYIFLFENICEENARFFCFVSAEN